MKNIWIRSLLAVLLIVTPIFLPRSVIADEWEFVLAPYAMFPNISGNTSIGRVDGADVDVDTGDILDTLEFGGMLQVEAHHASGFGVILNYAFMRLGDEATGPLGFASFDAEIFQATLEGYGTYRYQYEGGALDAYAGVRWWDLDVNVDATLADRTRSFDRDIDWVDPVVGLRWLPIVAAEWRLLLQGDVGGFGISSDFTWNVMGGVVWDAWEQTSVFFLYRLLAVDYETGTAGTPDRFAYDTITQGPLLGIGFKF